MSRSINRKYFLSYIKCIAKKHSQISADKSCDYLLNSSQDSLQYTNSVNRSIDKNNKNKDLVSISDITPDPIIIARKPTVRVSSRYNPKRTFDHLNASIGFSNRFKLRLSKVRRHKNIR